MITSGYLVRRVIVAVFAQMKLQKSGLFSLSVTQVTDKGKVKCCNATIDNKAIRP
jgi:hypothetical protein